MTEYFETKPFKRKMHRAAAILLAVLSVISGCFYAYMEGEFWPLLVVGFLLFISRFLWVSSTGSLEIGPGGIIIQASGRRMFLEWSELGEFAPGHSVENHKVEFTLKGEKPLSEVYNGTSKLKLHTPRYLPDTFGMSAKELAGLLNKRMHENLKN
jgi:hypothetical protein